jgi:3-deoxy-D-arabino-heptulosonate 7-phosphate (DAHP) synthase
MLVLDRCYSISINSLKTESGAPVVAKRLVRRSAAGRDGILGSITSFLNGGAGDEDDEDDLVTGGPVTAICEGKANKNRVVYVLGGDGGISRWSVTRREAHRFNFRGLELKL